MQTFSVFGCGNTEIAAYQWFRRFGLVFGSDTKLIRDCNSEPPCKKKTNSPLYSIENKSFRPQNLLKQPFQWFRRFGLVFGSDTKLIYPSFCTVRETLITHPHAKFQRFRLLQYRDRCLSVVPAIRARIRVGYETDRSQLLRNPREPNIEPQCKISAFLFATIPRSLLISSSGDSGPYSVGYETDRSQLLHIPRDSNNEPPCKLLAFLFATIPRAPCISGSSDSGSYSDQIRN